MKYDHKVKFNGVYYESGQEVPIDESPASVSEEKTSDGGQGNLFTDSEINFESSPHKYTYEELKEIPVREIRKIAEDMGFEITKTIKEDVVNEFLSKQ